MKLILFGGSFDPPHCGHLTIIEHCIEKCDKLVLMPSAYSPLKKNPPIAEPKHRVKMLELLTQELKYPIQIDDWEINQSSPNYTYLTVQHLQKKHPKFSISLAIGADQLQQFQKWKNYQDILDSVRIIGFNRKNYDLTPLIDMNLTWIKDFAMDISSTEIRSKIASGVQKGCELPHAIWSYIIAHNLYGNA